MFKSPYDTFPCRQYKVSKLSDAIQEASIIHEVTREVGESLRILLPDETVVAPFGHPILVENGDNSYFVGDTRTCTKIGRDGKFSITSMSEYHIWLQRLVTQSVWEFNSPSDIYNLGPFQIRIYTRWIADNIKRRFGLEPQEHFNVMAIAAYFFYCINDVTTAEFYSETDAAAIAQVLSRNTGVDVDLLKDLMGIIPIMSNVDDLIHALQRHSGTVRLGNFNVVTLYQIIGSTWFGTNAREIACVAIEYPPTFAVLLYNALTNRGFKNAGLSQTVKPYERHEYAASFKANFDLMLMRSLENQ